MSDQGVIQAGLRAFVAVPLPEELRAAAIAIQQRLRVSGGVKWVEPENLHFTLRFLGYASRQTLDALAQSLAAALNGRSAFTITLAGVGAFPTVRRPRAVWIGVSEGAAELEELGRLAEEVSVAAGFEPEPRPFRAHLTLGRVKEQRPPAELVRALEAEDPHAAVGRMEVSEVVLMRSELRRTGPIYSRLATLPLRRPTQP